MQFRFWNTWKGQSSQGTIRRNIWLLYVCTVQKWMWFSIWEQLLFWRPGRYIVNMTQKTNMELLKAKKMELVLIYGKVPWPLQPNKNIQFPPLFRNSTLLPFLIFYLLFSVCFVLKIWLLEGFCFLILYSYLGQTIFSSII